MAKKIKDIGTTTGSRDGNAESIDKDTTVFAESDYGDGNSIDIVGARTNNLQNVSLSIPHNKLTVITGLSGSGKSSLAGLQVFRLLSRLTRRQQIATLAQPLVP